MIRIGSLTKPNMAKTLLTGSRAPVDSDDGDVLQENQVGGDL